MIDGFIIQSSLLVGIIPALILLYFSMKGWQGNFQEKILFLMIVAGFFIGGVLTLTEIGIFYNTITFITIFPFLGQIIKTVVLNMKRFQEKKETVLYGLGIGLGIGSIYPAAFIVIFQDISISLLIASIGIIFLHGATGAMIGYGIYTKNLLKIYFFSGGIFIVAYILLKIVELQLVIIFIGIILYWYAYKKYIKTIVECNNEKSKHINDNTIDAQD